MYTPFPTKQYKKSFKKLKRSGKFNEEELNTVIDTLSKGKILEPIYQDHQLHGEFEGYRECHTQGNLLLIYKKEKNVLILVLFDIGR